MYTSLNDPAVEASLQKQLDIIVRHTVDLYGNDCTIILAGGFGRGEGSIRVNRNKIAIPLHDFDTYVVTERTAGREEHEAMERNIIKELSSLVETDLKEANFVLGVEVVPRRSLYRLPPDLSTYEMKAASTVLYGPDVRSVIPVTSHDIALASGAITLFHRTTALLKNVEPKFLSSLKCPLEKRLEAVYECCKVYTEICTALSLLGGFYRPSYRLRAEDLQGSYSRFPELQEKIPNLPEDVRSHTRMKLASDFSSIIQKPMETWIETRRTLGLVLRFFLSKFLGVSPNEDWMKLCKESRRMMRWLFFREYLSFYLARLGIRDSVLVNVANLAFQFYDYQSFRLRVRRNGRLPASRLLSFTSPLLDVYLSSALVLFSLEDDGRVDPEMLDTGRIYLKRVFALDMNQSGTNNPWKDSRDLCVEGQRLYFGAKQQKKVL